MKSPGELANNSLASTLALGREISYKSLLQKISMRESTTTVMGHERIQVRIVTYLYLRYFRIFHGED